MTSSTTTLQAAVIGAGFIGQAHIESLRRLGIPIAGILGSSPESTRQAAAHLGLRPYDSLAELLGDGNVSVVHQCGPNDIHAAQNLAALAQGKQIFSEKPLGVSVQECAEQLRAAERVGQRHAVNFTYRGYAAVQTLRDLVLGGELGEVRYLRGHYLQDWLLFPGDFNWRVTAPAAETRAVADIGSHLSDLARYVTGLEPERLYARFSTLHPQRQRPVAGFIGGAKTFGVAEGTSEAVAVATEDQATILADYAGGVRANFELSQVAPGHKNDLQLEIMGTKGSVLWRQEAPEQLETGTRSHQRILRLKDAAHPLTHYPDGHPEGYPDALTNVIRAFYTELGGGERPYPTFRDGLAAAQFVEAAYHSAVQNNWQLIG